MKQSMNNGRHGVSGRGKGFLEVPEYSPTSPSLKKAKLWKEYKKQ